MPSDALKALEAGGFNAILLGPVGDPRVADHITLWGMLLPIRQGFDQYINLRPIRLLRGVIGPLAKKGPEDIDIVCVRENCEGEYWAELADVCTRELRMSWRCRRQSSRTAAWMLALCAMLSSTRARAPTQKK